MPLYRFGQNDIFHNRIKAHPRCDFFLHNGRIYYNNRNHISGAFTDQTLHAPTGSISLYELNVDRPDTGLLIPGDHGPVWSINTEGDLQQTGTEILIYPFLYKDGTYSDFKTLSLTDIDGVPTSTWEATEYGDILIGTYPLSASIAKEYFPENHAWEASQSISLAVHCAATPPDLADPDAPLAAACNVLPSLIYPETEEFGLQQKTSMASKIRALKNKLDSYMYMSPHYAYSTASNPVAKWNKAEQEMGLVSIPSIYYGSSIKKGTVDLKFYITGTLIGELKDEKHNGELVQVGPPGSIKSGSTAGVVMYNEGFLLLTGSWDLTAADAAAVGKITFSGRPRNGDTIALSDTAGNKVVFKFATDNDTVDGSLHTDGVSVNVGISGRTTPASVASYFDAAVDAVTGYAGHPLTLNISSAVSSGLITLTQDTAGSSGNTIILINVHGADITQQFIGGHDGVSSPAHTEKYIQAAASSPRWIDFAQTIATGSLSMPSSSFSLHFDGTNYVPTVTMLAHARKGHLNFSNNPTYIEQGQTTIPITSSVKFREQPELKVKNTVSSSYEGFTASYKRQTYISKIGIYDKRRNLIGVAKVATPVKKTEERDFTFKLKLDF